MAGGCRRRVVWVVVPIVALVWANPKPYSSTTNTIFVNGFRSSTIRRIHGKQQQQQQQQFQNRQTPLPPSQECILRNGYRCRLLSTTSLVVAAATTEHPSNNNDDTTITNDYYHDTNNKEGTRNYWKELFILTRPRNIPGVIALHCLGTYMSIVSYSSKITTTTTTASTYGLFQKLIQHPSMMIVLISLLLTSSTSMLINDYYDSKLGRDGASWLSAVAGGTTANTTTTTTTVVQENPNTKIAVVNKKGNVIPSYIIKNFLHYLYSISLLLVSVIPGSPTRFLVIIGLLLTYLYTSLLKPITFLKNITCALLIALSPLTSGLASQFLLFQTTTTTTNLNAFQLLVPSLSLLRLFGILFCAIMGREILMDIMDIEDDRLSNIATIPVKYGRRKASQLSCLFSLGSIFLLLASPFQELLTTTTATTSSPTLYYGSIPRRFLLSILSSLFIGTRLYQIVNTKSNDERILKKAIDEGNIVLLLVLLSFI